MNIRQRDRDVLHNAIIIYNNNRSIMRVVFSCTEAIAIIKHLTSISQDIFKTTTVGNYWKLSW